MPVKRIPGSRLKLAALLVVTTSAYAQAPELVSRIRNSVITTIAGSERVFRGEGGTATEVALGAVLGLAADRDGNVYIAAREFHVVLKVSPDGIIQVAAGNGFGAKTGDGGPATQAGVVAPDEVALDSAGNLYIVTADQVRKVDTDGIISTIPGVFSARGIAIAPSGNLFTTDKYGHRVLRYNADGSGEEVVVGNGVPGDSGDGGMARDAQVGLPTDVALTPTGDLFIADETGKVRRVRDAVRLGGRGVIDTVVGLAAGGPREGPIGQFGRTGGNDSVTFDQIGNLFFGAEAAIYRADPQLETVVRVAGQGGRGFGGDGGRARDALIDMPTHLAVDGMGNLFSGGFLSHVVRKIENASLLGGEGTITTFAGDGRSEGSLEVEPALQTMFTIDFRLTVDGAGRVYISDHLNNVIRVIGTDSIVRRIAGNLIPGFSGDGGPASRALLNLPAGIAVDGDGNIFFLTQDRLRVIDSDGIINTVARGPFGTVNGSIAVANNGDLFVAGTDRILRVSNGVVETIAGTGQPGFSGDGGPAIEARFQLPWRLALGLQGEIYVSDFVNRRVRRISPDGTIETVAGNGGNECRPYDGETATAVPLAEPIWGSVVHPSGNLLFGSCQFVHLLTPEGRLYTVSGEGGGILIGDGGPASRAFPNPSDIALDDAGNIYIADWSNTRIRKILAVPPVFADLPQQVMFAGSSGGPAVESDEAVVAFSAHTQIGAGPPLAGVPFSAVAQDEAAWLRVSPNNGTSPRRLTLTADPSSLAPGTYRGLVEVRETVGFALARMIEVVFDVGPAPDPILRVDANSLSFTYPNGAGTRQENFVIANAGGGQLNFAIQTETDSGGDWLTVSPVADVANPGRPVTIDVSANPEGLAAGTYTGRVRVEADSGGAAEIPVTMTVSDVDEAILLTQRGLSYEAVVGGGLVPPQTFGVINLGRGSMDWSVSTCTLTDVSCDWLRVTPESGVSSANGEAPQITVSVDQTGLAAGDYFGLVEVRAGAAANTPQLATVYLEVLPEGANAVAALDSREVNFTATAGVSPSSQTIEIYNVAAEPKTFRTSLSLEQGFLEALPREGVLDPRNPTKLVVQPFTEHVQPGEYGGTLTMQFSDGRIQEVTVNLLVVAAAPAGSGRVAQSACSPSKLLPAMRTLGSNFAVSAGWPVGLQVDLRDDCGNPVDDGNVVVEFSNGDPQVSLTSLNNGRWDGTWQTSAQLASDITLNVEASLPSPELRGSTRVRGGLRSNQRVPSVPSNGIVGAAAVVANQPLAPGNLISLFGVDLSEGLGVADALPLPETIQDVSLFIAGRPLPLLFASNGQINAMVPYGLRVNTSHQVLVQRGAALSLPVSVNVAAAQPAIFKPDPAGSQGHIYRNENNGLADASNPAQAGDAIIVYCAGLGPVDPPVEAGSAALADPLNRTVNTVQLSIGGAPATVFFAGLTPGLSGLYQVNALVPEGLGTSDSVAVLLRTAAQSSPPVTMAVQ